MKSLLSLATLALVVGLAAPALARQVGQAPAANCCVCNIGTDADGNPVITCPCNRKVGAVSCIINSTGCITVGSCIAVGGVGD